jgi:hypothetical protein
MGLTHGVYTGIVNRLWITGTHLLFFNRYLAGHPQEAELVRSIPFHEEDC